MYKTQKIYPRRPSDSIKRDETGSAPSRTIALRPVRPTAELIQPSIPDVSEQLNLPTINPRKAKRPVALPGSDIVEKITSAGAVPEMPTGTNIAPPRILPKHPIRKAN